MAKVWDEMSDSEKIEDLRRDVVAIMGHINSWTAQIQQIGADHNRLSNLVSEVAKAVEKLESLAGK